MSTKYLDHEEMRHSQQEQEIRKKYERMVLALIDEKSDFSGVVVLKHVFREGRITGTVAKDEGHKEIRDGWKRLSELRL